ncbi:MAG: TOBE domain-containing protein, partial [Chloroflexia bacterium]
ICRFVADFIGESNFLNGRIVERDAETVSVEVGERLLIRAAAGPDSVLAERGQLGELTPGRAVTVAVRPEKIRLLREPPSGLVNLFRGRIEEVVYVGTETQFRVRLEDGSLLAVRQQNVVSAPDPSAYYGGQDAVYLAWQPESTLVLLE